MTESIWGPIFQTGKLKLRGNLSIDGVIVQYSSQRLFKSIIDVLNKNTAMRDKYYCYAVYMRPTYHLFGLIESRDVIFVKLSDVDHVLGKVKDYLDTDTDCLCQTFVTRANNVNLIKKHAKRVIVHKEKSSYQTEYYKIKHLFGPSTNSLQACGSIYDSRDYCYYRDFCDFCRGIIITDMKS